MPVGTPVEGGSGGGGSSGIGTGGTSGSGLNAREVKSLIRRTLATMLPKFGLPPRPENLIRDPLIITSGAIVNRVEVSDADYTLLEPDLLVAYTGLTGLRNVTLISRPAGQVVIIKDETGNADSFAIRVNAPSGYLIDGERFVEIADAYGSRAFYTNGTNWFTLDTAAFDASELVSESEALWLLVAALYGWIGANFKETIPSELAEIGFEMIGEN